MVFRCGSCSYVSDRRENLVRHINRKTGKCTSAVLQQSEEGAATQFQCRKDGCRAVFRYPQGRSRHEKTCRVDAGVAEASGNALGNHMKPPNILDNPKPSSDADVKRCTDSPSSVSILSFDSFEPNVIEEENFNSMDD